MSSDVIMTGPVFDGRAEAYVKVYEHNTVALLAERGAAWIKEFLPTRYKYLGHFGGNPDDNPVPPDAGYYESRVHAAYVSSEEYRITDDEVVYGPWLEGVSNRNETSRFKGYSAFRLGAQQLDHDAEAFANIQIQPYIGMMNL